MKPLPPWLEVDDEVQSALAEGRPVVALESSVWAHGLPRPMNLEVAGDTCRCVREAGAIPAIVALRRGRARIGISWSELEELCGREEVAKVGVGDLPAVLAAGRPGATTVSGTLALADLAGLQVFATGGLGGVHLNWNKRLDISSDLHYVARTRCLTVCSGVKSVLDVTNTLEVMETLAIPLVLYRTDTFPRFYTSGLPVGFGVRLDTPEEVARARRISLEALGRAPVVCQPVPPEHELPSERVEEWLRDGMLRAEKERLKGKQLTPFLLDHLARASAGATLEANRALLLANARTAAEIAAVSAQETPA